MSTPCAYVDRLLTVFIITEGRQNRVPFFYKPYKNVQCSLQDRENERFKSNAQAMIKKYGIFKQSVVIRGSYL